MRTLSSYAIASIALAALVAGTSRRAAAADAAGVARISDASTSAAAPNTLPVQPISASRALSEGVAPGCDSGNGDVGGCPALGVYPEGYRAHHWLHHGTYRQNLRWDYVRGPAIHAVIREPVGYSRWLPDVWYGDPRYGVPEGFPVAPMIYMPTDTTQLGYYYQRVPTWIPKPNLIPRAPLPSNFHRIDRPATASGSCAVGTRRGLFHGLFHHGSGCSNPQCGCRNCQCGANCGCRMESWSAPATPNYPTPANPGSNNHSQPDVPPKPGV